MAANARLSGLLIWRDSQEGLVATGGAATGAVAAIAGEDAVSAGADAAVCGASLTRVWAGAGNAGAVFKAGAVGMAIAFLAVGFWILCGVCLGCEAAVMAFGVVDGKLSAVATPWLG